MKQTKLKYDLKKPCKDCPFFKSSELHSGIAKYLPDYHANLERNVFGHTCHKTDNRSDSLEGKKYRGQPQHCAGSIAMMAQGKFLAQGHVIENISAKKWFKLKKTEGIWDSFLQMVLTYSKWMKEGNPVGKAGTDYL